MKIKKAADCVWLEEDLKELRKLIKKGFSIKAASEQVGIKTTDCAAALACKKKEIIGKHRSPNNNEKQEFIKRYERGEYTSQADAYRTIGVTQHEFRKWLAEYGTGEEPQRLIQYKTKAEVDLASVKANKALTAKWV